MRCCSKNLKHQTKSLNNNGLPRKSWLSVTGIQCSKSACYDQLKAISILRE